MANANGTSMVGGSVPVPPNAGIKNTKVSGQKVSKGKGGKGTRGKKFKQANGTTSGVMRTP
jgi:hypothetical protein